MKNNARVNGEPGKPKDGVNPIIILLGILFLAMLLTYIVESGSFQRVGQLVVPGTYETLEKDVSFVGIFALPGEVTEDIARPLGIVDTLITIPKGLHKGSALIFMVLIIGGMFGILAATGTIDAGLARLLNLVDGNIYILVPCLMIVFSAGSTFLGLASEYLLLIPVMTVMAVQLGQPRIIGLAIVTVAVKIGYIASVTSPISLTIAQPLVGLQIFSGAGVRFVFYLIFLCIGIAFILFAMRRYQQDSAAIHSKPTTNFTGRHKLLLLILVFGVGFLVYASNKWQWHHDVLSAYYIGLSIILSIASGIGLTNAANAFVDGMKKVLMASFLIGVATAVSIVLSEGQVLDTIVYSLTDKIKDRGTIVAAEGMFLSQMLLDFLIPSTSGQAAVSMPILGPIGQLTGVPQQTTVLAFLFGNGLTNMITPTSGTLLAYLATAQISWGDWARFIFPLWIIFGITAMILLAISTTMGF